MKTISGIFLCTVILLTGCVSTSSEVRKTIEDGDDAALQYYHLGARYFKNGSFKLAKERLERAIELDPKMANAHYTLALTYEQLGNVRLATEHYNTAVRVAPNNYDARTVYAVFLCRQQRFDEAVRQFERALKIPQNDVRHITLTNAGVCMIARPDFVQAEAYFRDALREKPTHGEALIQLAALKHKTDEHLQARAFLQRYLSGNKATPGTLYLGVLIEKALEDERAATDYMNQLLRDFPSSPEARRVLESG